MPRVVILLAWFLSAAVLPVAGPVWAAGEVLKLARQPGAAVTNRALPILLCILEKIDQPYEFIDVPWKRAQAGTQSGTYDGFFIASRTQNRDAYAVTSSPLMYTEWYFVTNKAQTLTPENSGFKGLNFGANIGTARYQWLDVEKQAGRLQGRVEAGANSAITWKMLARNRFDVLLENEQNLNKFLTQGEFVKEDFNIYSARKIPLSVYFGKSFLVRSPNFLTVFDSQIKDCQGINGGRK